ncbi:MAG: nitrate/nitrite transporter NrtS [Proteobacteria bacterium]|nr:nitrate/nitrite transporter NrtS [Pseudomonadota bacterium]
MVKNSFSKNRLRARHKGYVGGWSDFALINHGDTLLQGSFSAKTLFQITFTYLVPYGVSHLR